MLFLTCTCLRKIKSFYITIKIKNTVYLKSKYVYRVNLHHPHVQFSQCRPHHRYVQRPRPHHR